MSSDRGNKRMQVFDENGKFLDQWPFSPASNTQFLIIPADRSGIWAFEDTTAKVVKYDFEGHFLYAWGTLGDHPGGFFNMHGASVDQQGNLYIAEVGNGRLQKFRPRANANKALPRRSARVRGLEVGGIRIRRLRHDVACRLVPLMLVAGIATPQVISAHHSFAAEFDSSKVVTLTGSVTKVEWQNLSYVLLSRREGRFRCCNELGSRTGQSERPDAGWLDSEHLEDRRCGHR